MIKRSPCITNIKAGYLFPEIARRRREFIAAHPDTAEPANRIISLGVGQDRLYRIIRWGMTGEHTVSAIPRNDI
jgi:hypothetical protein